MSSLNKSVVVYVATHFQRSGSLLKLPFREVFRGPAPRFIARVAQPHKFYKYFTRKNLPASLPHETWSELGALLSGYPWSREDIVGLYHYRCGLDLTQASNTSLLPAGERNAFFEAQSRFMQTDVSNTLYVGEPLTFKVSSWQQFLDCESQTKNLEELLEASCLKFDELLGREPGYSATKLKTSNAFYSRNLFVGPRAFANSWCEKTIRIIEFLSSRKPDDVDARWGAYIIERLFSVFIEHSISAGDYSLETRRVVFFS